MRSLTRRLQTASAGRVEPVPAEASPRSDGAPGPARGLHPPLPCAAACSSRWNVGRSTAVFVFLALSGVLSAHTAIAAEVDVTLNDPVVWSNIGVNNNVRVTTPGVAVVNPAACVDPDSYIVSSALSAPLQSRLLAVLLAAKAAGRTVVIRIDGCEQGRLSITSARY